MDASEIIEILSTCKDIGSAAMDVVKGAKGKKDKLVPNPFFVQNGIEGESTHTKKSLWYRKLKSSASTIFGLVGDAGSSATVVNVADIAKHGASTASSAIHLRRLMAMADKVKDGGSLRKHLDLLILLKGAKTAARGAQTVFSCIPIPGMGAASGAVGAGHKYIVVKSRKEAILRTALAIHWQAYRELVLLRGSTTESGPALRICRELVTLSATHVHKKLEMFDFGKLHSVKELNEILMEPVGYHLLVLKLEQT